MWEIKYNSVYSLFFEYQGQSFHRKSYKVLVNGKIYHEKLTVNSFSIFQTLNGKVHVQIINEKSEHEFDEIISLEDKNYYLNVNTFLKHLDNEEDHTQAIQALILSVPDNTSLFFPARKYNITSLFLRSNLKLIFEEAAIFNILTQDKKFPVLPDIIENKNFSQREIISTWEGNPQDCHSSIISGYYLKNVELIGPLKIEANASKENWWKNVKQKKIAWRPKTLYFNQCENIKIHGLKIYNSPSWSIHPFYSQNIKIFDTFIFNPADSPNTDGINPESCQNIEINGATFDVGDDCIAIKSGKIYQSKYHNQACEDILIKNCKMEHGHGAIVLGSEISSGVKRLKIENCLFNQTDRGLRVKTRRGRGEKSVIDDIQLTNIEMIDVKAAFTINAYYNCDPDGNSDYVASQEEREVDERTPFLGQFYFKNISCKNLQQVVCMAYGLKEQPIESITIENSLFEFSKEESPGYPLMMREAKKVSRVAYKFLNVNKVKVKNNQYINVNSKNKEFKNVESLEELNDEYCR
ncbi:MAG: glycoside hydrolase family 28 protein [Lactovum sp.]